MTAPASAYGRHHQNSDTHSKQDQDQNMTAPKRHSLALLATVLLTAAIAYLTLTPPRPEASAGLLSDKAYHVIAFASLIFPGALLYLRSLI